MLCCGVVGPPLRGAGVRSGMHEPSLPSLDAMSRASLSLTGLQSRSGARATRPAVWAVLATSAVLCAHELVYQLRFGPGDGYQGAMRVLGHEAYWLAAVTIVAILAGSLAWVSVVQLRRLRREAAAPAVDPSGGARTLVALTVGVWWRLALSGLVLFLLQENLEAIAIGAAAPGLDVIIGPDLLAPLAIAILALLLAAVVALVHWRRLVLLGRIRALAPSWPRRPRPLRRPPVIHVCVSIEPVLRGPVRAPPVAA